MSKQPRIIIPRTQLDTLRDEMAELLRVGFVKGMTSIRADVSPDELLKAIQTGSFKGLRKDIEGRIRDLANPLLAEAVSSTATKTIEAMPELPNKAFRLSATNPRVKAYIKSRTTVLAQGTKDGVEQAIKATGRRSTIITTLHKEPKLGRTVSRMVSKSLDVGMTLPQRAAMIRQCIGLNDVQAQALVNFRNAQVAQGVDGSKLLARVAGYEDRMLDYRAQMIGRQEVRNAQNAAQLAVWQQAVDDEYIPKTSKKVWHCELKPCEEWCRNMRGVGVPLDEPWQVTSTRTQEVREVDIPSDIHPQCMCSQSIDVG